MQHNASEPGRPWGSRSTVLLLGSCVCALRNSATPFQSIDLDYATRIHQSHPCHALGLGSRCRSHCRQLAITAGLDGSGRCRGRSATRHDVAMEITLPEPCPRAFRRHADDKSGRGRPRRRNGNSLAQLAGPRGRERSTNGHENADLAGGHQRPVGGVGLRSARMRHRLTQKGAVVERPLGSVRSRARGDDVAPSWSRHSTPACSPRRTARGGWHRTRRSRAPAERRDTGRRADMDSNEIATRERTELAAAETTDDVADAVREVKATVGR